MWDAFVELSTCRPGGEGVRAIPWTAIDQYARAHDVRDLEAFERMIRAMDSEYLRGFNRRVETAKKSAGGPSHS